MSKRPLLASPPWTLVEDEELRNLARSGEPPTIIAERLHRSAAAVRQRFYKLGIPLKRASSRADKGSERNFANHHERQFMEYMRGMVWVRRKVLPPTDRLLSALLKKGWIEERRQNSELLYRMTEVGLTALKAPVPIQESWPKPQVQLPEKAKGK